MNNKPKRKTSIPALIIARYLVERWGIRDYIQLQRVYYFLVRDYFEIYDEIIGRKNDAGIEAWIKGACCVPIYEFVSKVNNQLDFYEAEYDRYICVVGKIEDYVKKNHLMYKKIKQFIDSHIEKYLLLTNDDLNYLMQKDEAYIIARVKMDKYESGNNKIIFVEKK